MAQQNANQAFQPENVVMRLQKSTIFPFIRFTRLTTAGTGWCLDPGCGFVVSNYHVAVALGSAPKIYGEKVLGVQLASSPTDDGAVWMPSVLRPMRYSPIRDIAIFQLDQQLARKGMHGIPFSIHHLQTGERVTIYAYPKGESLIKISGTFTGEVNGGVLDFRVGESADGRILRGGTSGGLVINQKNQAVGLLFGVGKDRATAVPIWSLADFVKSIRPRLYAELFPEGVDRPDAPVGLSASAEPRSVDQDSEAAAGGMNPKSVLPDTYLRYEFDKFIPPFPRSKVLVLAHRTEEAPEIQTLRKKAQLMADGMNNFIALQIATFGGDNVHTVVSRVETRVVYGKLTFQRWPDGTVETGESVNPAPMGIMLGDEWKGLPYTVGTALRLKIQEGPDRQIRGYRVRVFQYEGTREDRACICSSDGYFILFHRRWTGAVACHGEVWTDENFNILRIREQDSEFPESKTFMRELHLSVIYGWYEGPEGERQLVPTSILEQSKVDDGHVYWYRGDFAHYHMFTSSVKLIPKRSK